jgi:hypothetical protein
MAFATRASLGSTNVALSDAAVAATLVVGMEASVANFVATVAGTTITSVGSIFGSVLGLIVQSVKAILSQSAVTFISVLVALKIDTGPKDTPVSSDTLVFWYCREIEGSLGSCLLLSSLLWIFSPILVPVLTPILVPVLIVSIILNILRNILACAARQQVNQRIGSVVKWRRSAAKTMSSRMCSPPCDLYRASAKR